MPETVEKDVNYLLSGIMETFQSILRENPYETSMNQEEIKKRLQYKKELRNALKTCVFGDRRAKTYVKDHMKDILVGKYKLDEQAMEEAIPFSRKEKLTPQDKFDILLYFYFREYGYRGLDRLISEYELDLPKRDELGLPCYVITAEDVESVYDTYHLPLLRFNDKLAIVTQRIYQNYKGNGPIDEIRDMKIDGVSGGVSGLPPSFDSEEFPEWESLPKAYDSIWIFFRGKSIHLSFLSFQSERELIRVCKNIYRYGNPGALSEVSGYTVNEMKDGSRVSVARPPFSETWLFFVRKFDSVLKENIQNLITDEDGELPIQMMKWLVSGCQVTAVTGEQGSGKTTLLMALIGFINPMYNLRIHELSFELNLRKIYPNRNIASFRETGSVSGQEGLDFSKKTDGTVSILGEVASLEVSAWLVQMSQVASLFTLFTHHAKTTSNLITYLRNALLKEGGFRNERAAAEQVTDAVNFDIHMRKDSDGHRYIERITEIIPRKGNEKEFHGLADNLFETRDLVVFEKGRYVKKQRMSLKAGEKIAAYLEGRERKEFWETMLTWESRKEVDCEEIL